MVITLSITVVSCRAWPNGRPLVHTLVTRASSQSAWTRSDFSVLTHLGLVNEVQRPDRDEYIEVNSFSISEDFKQLFQKHSEWSLTNEGYPFDIASVMMFDSYDFTKDWFKNFQKFSKMQLQSTLYQTRYVLIFSCGLISIRQSITMFLFYKPGM